MHDVRQAGFQIHQLAKKAQDIVIQTSLRVVGQAIATGHMREHAMVASDYAIKVINLLFPNDVNAVKQERLWRRDAWGVRGDDQRSAGRGSGGDCRRKNFHIQI